MEDQNSMVELKGVDEYCVSGIEKRGSVLYQPVKVLGTVIDDLPLCQVQLGKDVFFTASVGKAFHVFDEKLRLSYISPHFTSSIRAIHDHNGIVYTAFQRDIISWKKMKPVQKFVGHKSASKGLLVFGSQLLSYNDLEVLFFDIATGELLHSYEASADQRVTCLLHPPTLLNKVLIGFNTGELLLLNTRTYKAVHWFRSPNEKKSGVSLTCLEPSPVLDIIALGYGDGTVSLLDVKMDKVLFSFQQETRVTCIGFRGVERRGEMSEIGEGRGSLLLSGGEDGKIGIWCLERRKLLTSFITGHEKGVTSLSFIAGNPSFVTSGRDNSIRVFYFPQDDSSAATPSYIPLPLRERCGVHGVISSILMTSEETTEAIVSTQEGRGEEKRGEERGGVYKFSFIQSHQNMKYSEKHLSKQQQHFNFTHLKSLPPVTSLASTSERLYDWPATLTTHKDFPYCMVWSSHQKRLVQQCLFLDKTTTATHVSITNCGSVCVVSYANGAIVSYYVQTGKKRGYLCRSSNGRLAHEGRVSHTLLCSLTWTLLSLCPEKKEIGVWDLRKNVLKRVIRLPLSFVNATLNGVLLAVVCDNGDIAVVDIHSGEVVRTFSHETARLRDGEEGEERRGEEKRGEEKRGGEKRGEVRSSCVKFSRDMRYVFVGYDEERTMEVWDLLSNVRVDWIRFESALTALDFDANNNFMYTTHENSKGGITVWASKYMFDISGINYLAANPPTAPICIEDPPAEYVEKREESGEREEREKREEREERREKGEVQPVFEGFATMSNKSFSEINNILLLEIIKARNKVQEGEKEKRPLPFILQNSLTSNGWSFFDGENAGNENFFLGQEGGEERRGEERRGEKRRGEERRKDILANDKSEFSLLLESHKKNPHNDEFWKVMRNSNASKIHLLLHNLSIIDNTREILMLLDIFIAKIRVRTEVDLCHAVLHVFLTIYAEDILTSKSAPMHQLLIQLHQEIALLHQNFNQSLNKITCYLKYLAQIAIDA